MKSEERIIIAEPTAGIGNRILMLLSVIYLCEIYHRKLIVLWNNNSDLNAEFEDLFQLSEEIRVIRVTTDSIRKKMCRRIYSYFVRRKIRKRADFIFDSNEIKEQDIEIKQQWLLRKMEEDSIIYIRSWKGIVDFAGKEVKLMSNLKTAKGVIEQGNHLYRRISADTIGLHIRRNDHTLAIKNSPVELFCNIVNGEISKNGKIQIYLATDDREIEELFEQRYGDVMIIHQNKNFARDSKQGIIDAMIDMEALSRCQKIYGSYGSTFSRVASYKGGIPLIIVEK